MGGSLEVELRFLIDNIDLIRKKLEEVGAASKYSARVVDYWYIPSSLMNKEQEEKWFNEDLGVAIRIREKFKNETESDIFLESKQLTEAKDHSQLLETSIDIDSVDKADEFLKMLGRKRFLTIDKQREVYEVEGHEISIDSIKDCGVGIEIESSNAENVDKAIKGINKLARKLEIPLDSKLEKSMTV